MKLLKHSSGMKKSAASTLFGAIAALAVFSGIQSAGASLADEAIAKGDELFNKAVSLSRQGDHVESARSFVEARVVYGKYLKCRARFRECNKLLVEELKKRAEIARSRGNLDLARWTEETASKIQQSDLIAFSDENNWREQPMKLYQDAYNELCEKKARRNQGKNIHTSDIVVRKTDSSRAQVPKSHAGTSVPVAKFDDSRGDFGHARGAESRRKDTSSLSTFDDSLFKAIVLIFGVVLPALLFARSRRKHKARQAAQTSQTSASPASGQSLPPVPASTTAPVSAPKKVPVYSFEEQSVRDFVEQCRVRGMPCGSTNDFRLSVGECVHGRMNPAALFETISATNLNMRHISTGVLYATNRRFVYVAGSDVRVIPYNDVIKFESNYLFGFDGEISLSLVSRRKRMEFLGPNSFKVSMAFKYVTDNDIHRLLQLLNKLGPDDPGVEDLIQTLLSVQVHPPSTESSGSSFGCVSSIFSFVMGAAILFGLYKVICWMISTAKVN